MKSVTAHRPVHAIRRDLEEIDALAASRGWSLLSNILDREADSIIKAMTGSVHTAKEILDFQRAGLRAVKLLQSLPETQALILKNELELAEAHEGAKEKTDVSE